MDREEAAKELMAMLEEAQEGPYYSEEEVRAHLLEILAPRNQVYITGDTHGQFERVIEFCARREVEPENTFVILGDAGLNYYNDRRDRKKKGQLAQVPITFFCLHGNHEMRPSEELGYEVAEYHGGKVWMQPAYPNILFAIDGEVYDFNGNSCIVIGGAYSVDKYYRLARGWSWFPDEQPSEEIKAKVERVLAERSWKIDIVLSHTGPLKYEPTEVFNTTFTNPYLYSAVYNGSYVFIDMVLCLVITALLSRPLSRYFAPQETVAAKKNQGPEL